MSMSDDAPTRKRRSLPSMMSRISDTVSMKSRTSSIFSRIHKGILGAEHVARPQMKLRWRDWLLAFTELCLAFSWGSFMARAQSNRTLKMRKMTPRDEMIERLFWNGWAAIGNILMGHLADSYTRNYGIVIINVLGHLTLAGLFFMSEVINVTASEDEYGLLLSDVFVWLYIPIRSTDFARVAYGMEQLAGKSSALVLYFAFLLQLADQAGSFLFLVLNSSGMSFHMVTFVAFTANGIVLFFYSYVLRPLKAANIQFSRGIAVKFWGSVITALSNKRRFGQRVRKKSWLDFAETRYDKTHLMKTKKLMKMFLLILPTAGFLLFVNNSDEFFDSFWTGLNRSGKTNVYTLWGVYSSTLITMIFFELMVIPWMACLNIRINFYRRFLTGYTAMIVALFFAALTMKSTEKIHIGHDKAVVRLINTKSHPIHIESYDTQYSSLNYSVLTNKMVTYKTKIHRLLMVNIRINNHDNYTMYLSLEPYALVGVLFVDPDILYRISGQIPILEGPPGLNNKVKPRCFVANFIPEKNVVLEVINMDTYEKTSVDVAAGGVTVFQVLEGSYMFQLRRSSTRVFYEVWIGGVYGIYMYVDLDDYRMKIDKVVPENTTPPLMGLGIAIPMGIARGVGLVALVAFVFTNSPEGLKGIALGYLFSLSQFPSWGLLIGFYTWHRHLSAESLIMYSLIATCLFFVSLVLIVKYRNLYKT